MNNRGGIMTRHFDLSSEVLKGLMGFCGDNLQKFKSKGSWEVFRVPSLFQHDVTGYFFLSPNQNVLVLTHTALEVEKLIDEEQIERSLKNIKALNN